jgi:hypothetical protein
MRSSSDHIPLPTWKLENSSLPSWEFMRPETNPSSSSLRFFPVFGSHMQTNFVSLRFSTYLSHFLNSCHCFLENNSLNGHFTLFFMGHSYTQCVLASCCIFNARCSIHTLISASSLSISSLLICWWSPLPPSSRPSVAIFFMFLSALLENLLLSLYNHE